MSRFTLDQLFDSILRGITDECGNAWWFQAEKEAERIKAGKAPSHYAGFVPFGAAERLLGSVKPVLVVPTFTYVGPDGKDVTVRDESRRGVIDSATGEVFYVGTDGYNPHGGYVDALLKETQTVIGTGLGITSAGMFDNGAEAFVSVSLNDTVRVEGATAHPYLLNASSLNGKRAKTRKVVFTLVECDNTYDAAMSEHGATFTEKHTKDSHDGSNIDEQRAAIGVALEQGAEEIESLITEWAATPVTVEQRDAFLNLWTPLPEAKPTKSGTNGRGYTLAENSREQWLALYGNDPRCAPWTGTKFGIVQTTNTFEQHYSIVRSADGDDADKSAVRAVRNMQNTLSGKTAESDKRTLSLIDRVLATV